MNVCPAIVAVPVRDDTPTFAATWRSTDPSPLPPSSFFFSVIHALLLTTVHSHSLLVRTATVTLAAFAGTVALVGEIEYEQGFWTAPACWTVKIRPAIVNEPVREPPVLAATTKVIFPLPVI